MLDGLRDVLEAFEESPDNDTFEALQREIMQIEFACESEITEDENVQRA